MVANGVSLSTAASNQQRRRSVQHTKRREQEEEQITVNSNTHEASISNPIREIFFSPVCHRPNSALLEQVVIGMNGLKKLGVHLNFELQQPEIEEEEVLDNNELKHILN